MFSACFSWCVDQVAFTYRKHRWIKETDLLNESENVLERTLERVFIDGMSSGR